MNKIYIFTILFFISAHYLQAQDNNDNPINTDINRINKSKDIDKNKGLFGILQFKYIKNYHASTEINTDNKTTRNDLNTDKARAYSLNFIAGYFVIPKRLSLGLGFGLDGYHTPNLNTAPLYADLRFYFTNEKNAFYMLTNLGLLLKLGGNFRTGINAKLGLGYKFFITKQLCLTTDVGINTTSASLTNEPYNFSKNIITLRGTMFTLGIIIF